MKRGQDPFSDHMPFAEGFLDGKRVLTPFLMS